MDDDQASGTCPACGSALENQNYWDTPETYLHCTGCGTLWTEDLLRIPDRRTCPHCSYNGSPNSLLMSPVCKFWACYICLSCVQVWAEESSGDRVITPEYRERKLAELRAPGAIDSRVKWSWKYSG